MTKNKFAPAPHDETEEYTSFMKFFSPISIFSAVAMAYAVYWVFGVEYLEDQTWLFQVFPFLVPRLEFLAATDGFSGAAYIATIISGMWFAPLMLIGNALGYWRTVVVKGKCRPVSGRTVLIIGINILVFSVLMWICFVDVPSMYNPQRPGMA
ncbi:MAG: hypothetical protein JKY00_13730, partial [Roseicyclus sp.]|nr:hypothetical protein [Roseicyclus sp.]